MIKIAILAAAAALGTGAALAPAHAESVTVNYKDLDLTTAEGKSKLARRLDTAARTTCGYGSSTTGSRMPSASASACYKEARAKSKDNMAAIIEQAQKGG
jgi:UrcA family protein